MQLQRSTVPLLFAALAAVTAWLCATLPVFSQEAYYWTYAQHPALSYFDHPPMVAWLIWVGTALFGDGAFGLRFGTWICGLGTTWFGLLLLRDFGVDRRGQALWMLLGFGAPILTVARVLTNPDPPLACCWTITMWALWRARSGAPSSWVIAGLAAGTALLSKYTAAFLAVGGVIVLLLDKPLRRQIRTPGPWLALGIAGVVFTPVLVWNIRNHFESFRFQTEGRFARGELTGHWFVEFAGEQIGLLNPFVAVLLPFSIWWLLRHARHGDARAALLAAFGLPLLGYMLVQSFWIQVKANWLVPAYVPLLLGLVVWWRESGVALSRPRLLACVTGSMVILLAAVPLAPLVRILPPSRGSSWTGWDEIARRADAWEDVIDPQDGIEGNVFYFAADYRDAAQLGRNILLYRRAEDMGEHPEVGSIDFEPTMAQNVLGLRALQYDHWSSPWARVGQDAIFVLPRPEQRAAMVAMAARHFERMELGERVEIRRWGVHLFDADVYVCHGYRGPPEVR